MSRDDKAMSETEETGVTLVLDHGLSVAIKRAEREISRLARGAESGAGRMAALARAHGIAAPARVTTPQHAERPKHPAIASASGERKPQSRSRIREAGAERRSATTATSPRPMPRIQVSRATVARVARRASPRDAAREASIVAPRAVTSEPSSARATGPAVVTGDSPPPRRPVRITVDAMASRPRAAKQEAATAAPSRATPAAPPSPPAAATKGASAPSQASPPRGVPSRPVVTAVSRQSSSVVPTPSASAPKPRVRTPAASAHVVASAAPAAPREALRRPGSPPSPAAPGAAARPILAPPQAAMAPPARTDQQGGQGSMQGDVYLDGTRVGRWMSGLMAREAARPPIGGRSFNPRDSPARPGMGL